MRNLFKKSLAICLAIALCLTAMVGLTVSAEDATITGTITAKGAEVEADATTATVSFTLDATDLSEVILSLEASEGATISGVAAPEGTTAYAVIPKAEDDFSLIAFSTYEVGVVTSAATVEVTVAFEKAADYTVTATLGYGMGATNKEELIVVADPAVANITVKAAAHVHTPAEAVVENEVPATCYSKGSYDSVVYCTAEGCDLENKEISRETITVDETDHTPAAAVVENNVDPTCTVAGSYDSVVYCSVEDCKKEISRTTVTVDALGHTWGELEYSVSEEASCITKHTCTVETCLTVEIISEVASAGAGHTGIRIYRSPVLDAGLAIKFRTLSSASTGYTDVHGIFTKTMYADDGTSTEIEPDVTPLEGYFYDEDWGTDRYTFNYEGISSKEMTSNINIKIYGTNADGYVCLLGTLDYTLASYIQSNYGKYGETLTTLLGDLAFYGAAAQDYFNYNVANKPNEGIESHTALPTTFDTTDESMEGGIAIGKAPDLANKVLINFRFSPDAVEAYGTDVRFEVDYTTPEGTTDTFVKDISEFDTLDDGRYNIVFDSLTAPTINTIVVARIVTGENTVLGQLRYTLERYAYNRYNSSTTAAITVLTQALVNYGNSAAAYF